MFKGLETFLSCECVVFFALFGTSAFLAAGSDPGDRGNAIDEFGTVKNGSVFVHTILNESLIMIFKSRKSSLRVAYFE